MISGGFGNSDARFSLTHSAAPLIDASAPSRSSKMLTEVTVPPPAVQHVISQEAGSLLDYGDEAISYSLQHLIDRTRLHYLVSPYRYVHPLLVSLASAGVAPSLYVGMVPPSEPRRITRPRY